jgi:hypothetical protein
MNVLMLGAVAGGFSGAFGYFLAGRVHGEEKVETLYPVYAVIFFGAMVAAAKFLPIH